MNLFYFLLSPHYFLAEGGPSGATGRHATLRTSCPNGLGSSTLPLVNAGRTGVQLAFIRPATRIVTGVCNFKRMTPVGQSPMEFHKLRSPGATPGPAISAPCGTTNKTAEYANWKSGQVESLVILWVQLPPQSLRSRGPTVRHQPDMLATMVQLHPGSIDGL